MTETLLDLKEDVKLRAIVNEEGIFAYILIKNSHPNLFQQLEASIIVFLTGLYSGIFVYSCTGCIQLKTKQIVQITSNSRETIRLKLNDFVKINFDSL